ncbi:hypothetical protein HMPREF9451_01858, partial [Slackia piriformis YIT 12062]
MYSTRSGATPRIASLMAELGKSAEPPRKKERGPRGPLEARKGPCGPSPARALPPMG